MNLDIKIKDLAIGGKQLALANQKKQGKEINEEAHLMDKEKSFDFSESNEGPDFWGLILEGDFFSALDIYKGAQKLFIIDASNDHATFYLKDQTFHYDFSGMKNQDTTEVFKSLKTRDRLIDEAYLPLFGTKKKEDTDPKTIEVIESFQKKWNKRRGR